MACFADIRVSQGSVATHGRCGGMFNMHLTANLLKNLPVKKFVNRLRFDRNMVMILWPRFFLAHPVDTFTGGRIQCARYFMYCSLVGFP